MKSKSYPPHDDEDRPTPIDSSGTYPVWRNGAREMAAKVREKNLPNAEVIIQRLKDFEETFASWSTTNRPDDFKRKYTIDRFGELYHELLIALAKV